MLIASLSIFTDDLSSLSTMHNVISNFKCTHKKNNKGHFEDNLNVMYKFNQISCKGFYGNLNIGNCINPLETSEFEL